MRSTSTLPTPPCSIVHERSQDLIDWAVDYGHYAHCERTPAGSEQLRKYSKMPYMVHPIRVATMLHNMNYGVDVVCAALLHDVLEDTTVTYEELMSPEVGFGYDICRLVLGVTDVSRPEMGNRKIRKAIDRQYLGGASRLEQIIKCADMIDNTRSIVEHDSKFAVIYLGEMYLLLKVLTKVEDTPIYGLAVDAYNKGCDALELKLRAEMP